MITDDINAAALSFTLSFCRIGACLMVLPMLGTHRVPVRFRLAISLALSMVIGGEHPRADATLHALWIAMIIELSAGLLLGFLVRLVVSMVSFAATLIASTLGFLQPLPSTVDDNEPSLALVDLHTSTAITTVILLDLHHKFLEALQRSYGFLPIGLTKYDASLVELITKTIDGATNAGLQLAAPILALCLVMNVTSGLINRALPMLPVQFLGAPAVLFVGMFLLVDIASLQITLFIAKMEKLSLVLLSPP